MRSCARLLPVILAAACAPPVSDSGSNAAEVGSRAVAAQVRGLPGVVSVEPADKIALPSRDGCVAYLIMFRLPVDHAQPDGATFAQRLVLQHCGAARPMVFSPDGYGMDEDFFQPDLVARLDGNWLWVEHRFFDVSMPGDSSDKTTLTIRQSADDDHAIVQSFRRMYRARWISTGASNGGANAVFHRRFYPDDVDGTVAYVAPFLAGAPDAAFPPFIEQLGDDTCRSKMLAFQRAALAHLADLADRLSLMNGTYKDPVDAVRDAIRNYRLTFWQYVHSCSRIPAADASVAQMYSALQNANSLFSDEDNVRFDAYDWQCYAELGYPVADLVGLEDLLSQWVPDPSTPYPSFDPSTLDGVRAWIQSDASRIAFIYGTNDPWTARAAQPDLARDNLVAFAPGSGHEADLSTLSATDQQAVLARLAAWAQVPLLTPQSAAIDIDRLGRRRAAAGAMIATWSRSARR